MIAIGQLGIRLYIKSQKEWLYWNSDVFFLTHLLDFPSNNIKM